VDVDVNYARELPCPSSDHLAEILTDLYENREKLDETAELCYQRATDTRFDWDTIASQFGGIFNDVLTAEEPSPEPVEKKKKKKARREKRMINELT
jgi:hypothetical protein